jgi:predicted permease
LWKHKAFAFITVLTITLGIAANALVFSVFNAVLLRSLPYPDSNHLMMLHWSGRHGQSSDDISAPAFALVKNHARSFREVTALDPINTGINLSGFASPQYVKALRVSEGFFRTLGTMPMGRSFTPQEDQPGGARALVLGYGLWVKEFNKEPDAIGRQLRVNGESYAIVGIMPPDFRSYPEADLWIPLQLGSGATNPGNDYRVIVRLKDSVSLEQARQELEQLSETYRQLYAPQMPSGEVILIMSSFQGFMTAGVRKNLLLLLAAVGFVLLIAATNTTLLVIVRALARSREFATRAALGGSRNGWFGAFFSDSFLLVVPGGVLGIILAKESIPLVRWIFPGDLPLAVPISIDTNVLFFSLAIVIFMFFVLGLSPTLKAFKTDPAAVLRQSSYSVSAGPSHMFLARGLIAAQAALTLVLLASAGMLLRNFVALIAVSPGFDPEHVMVLQVSLDSNRYLTPPATAQLVEKICGQIHDSPDIESVASVVGLPFERGLNLPMHPMDAKAKVINTAEYRMVSPEYFRVLRISTVAGKQFTETDDGSAAPVAMINETLAHLWWPQQPAVGQFVRAGEELGGQLTDVPRLVIGVLADVREAGLDHPAPPTLFIPLRQTPENIMKFANRLFLTSIVVRTRSQANRLEEVRRSIASLDPDLPLASARPLSQIINNSLLLPRFYASFTMAFSAFALLLTVTGVYGLLSYQVSQRVREIALRMAVGSSRSSVVLLIVAQGLRLIAIGMASGLIGCVIVSRLFKSMFYNGADQSSILSVLGVAVALMGVAAIAASGITAYRAASIEPMAVLRNE